MRRILNHTAPKTDVLHRHYLALGIEDVREGLERVKGELGRTFNGIAKT